MKEFVALVAAKTGAIYHPNAISLLEKNKQGWRLTDVRAFAAVDPLERGAMWLSALDQPAAEVPAVPKKKKPPLEPVRPEAYRAAPRRAGQRRAGGSK